MRRETGRVDRFCLELANSAADDGKVSMISALRDDLACELQHRFQAGQIRFLFRRQPHRHAWSLRDPASRAVLRGREEYTEGPPHCPFMAGAPSAGTSVTRDGPYVRQIIEAMLYPVFAGRS